MPDALGFLLGSLAVWRVTHLLADEDGPGDVIVWIRTRLGTGMLGRLMDCFYCLSLWVAAPAALLFRHDAREWVLYWLALSGAACLLERATDRPAGVPGDAGGDVRPNREVMP
ncbi:MAG: DUF1360 domain-containing protein [Vicinamibacterales bacterium]